MKINWILIETGSEKPRLNKALVANAKNVESLTQSPPSLPKLIFLNRPSHSPIEFPVLPFHDSPFLFHELPTPEVNIILTLVNVYCPNLNHNTDVKIVQVIQQCLPEKGALRVPKNN